jgi:hypothetical protein
MLVLRDWQEAVCWRRVRYHASANDTLLIRINESFVMMIFLCCCRIPCYCLIRGPTPVTARAALSQPTVHDPRARGRCIGVCRTPTEKHSSKKRDAKLSAIPGRECGSQAAKNGFRPLGRRTREALWRQYLQVAD